MWLQYLAVISLWCSYKSFIMICKKLPAQSGILYIKYCFLIVEKKIVLSYLAIPTVTNDPGFRGLIWWTNPFDYFLWQVRYGGPVLIRKGLKKGRTYNSNNLYFRKYINLNNFCPQLVLFSTSKACRGPFLFCLGLKKDEPSNTTGCIFANIKFCKVCKEN